MRTIVLILKSQEQRVLLDGDFQKGTSALGKVENCKSIKWSRNAA